MTAALVIRAVFFAFIALALAGLARHIWEDLR